MSSDKSSSRAPFEKPSQTFFDFKLEKFKDPSSVMSYFKDKYKLYLEDPNEKRSFDYKKIGEQLEKLDFHQISQIENLSKSDNAGLLDLFTEWGIKDNDLLSNVNEYHKFLRTIDSYQKTDKYNQIKLIREDIFKKQAEKEDRLRNLRFSFLLRIDDLRNNKKPGGGPFIQDVLDFFEEFSEAVKANRSLEELSILSLTSVDQLQDWLKSHNKKESLGDFYDSMKLFLKIENNFKINKNEKEDVS